MVGDQKDKSNEEFEVLFTESEIRERVHELGQEITKDYAEDPDTELVLIGILNGAAFFMTDLAREVEHPNLRCDFMSVSSYEQGTQSSRDPRFLLDAKTPLEGKNIILVEDIVDTGYSMETLLRILSARNPKSIKVCSLLSKPSRREIPVPIDYLGFEIPDLFVVGYGLDKDGEGRNRREIIFYP